MHRESKIGFLFQVDRLVTRKQEKCLLWIPSQVMKNPGTGRKIKSRCTAEEN